jgi:hypothetical protein
MSVGFDSRAVSQQILHESTIFRVFILLNRVRNKQQKSREPKRQIS